MPVTPRRYNEYGASAGLVVERVNGGESMAETPTGYRVQDVSHPAAVLEAALSEYRRRLTGRRLLACLAAAVAAAVLVPLLVVAADHAWPGGLPRPVMVGTTLLWALGLGLALIVPIALALLRRPGWLFVARHLEQARSIPHNAVVNAVLVRSHPETAYACEGAARQAAYALRAASPDARGEPGAWRKAGWALLVTAAAWLIYGILAPKPVLPSLARFLGADVLAPTATRLELVHPTEGEVVRAGESLEIQIGVSGRPVEEVRFELVSDASVAIRLITAYQLRRGPAADRDLRTLTLAPHEVVHDLHFRCHAGDAHLKGVILVEPQPDVEDLRIHLAPPPYTGEQPETAPGADLRVWAGTQATFELRANVDVRDPVFVFRGENETRTRMLVSSDDRCRASLTELLTESGTYRIEFTDRWGYPCRARSEHRIAVRKDAPPTVEIVIPAAGDVPDGVVDVSRFPELLAVASDDIRVSRVHLVHERGELKTRVELADAMDDDTRRGRVMVRVQAAELPLEPGHMLRVWFEAHDNRVLFDGTPAAQVGVSHALTLIRPVPERAETAEVEPADEGKGDETAEGAGEPRSGEATAGADEREQSGSGEVGETPKQTPTDDSVTDEQGRDDAESKTEGAPAKPDDSARPAKPDVEAAGSRGPDSAAGSSQGEFEREARAFEEKHGDEAREVARRLREPGARQEASDAGGRPEEPQARELTGDDSDRASETGEREPPGEGTASDGTAERPQQPKAQQPQEGEGLNAGKPETGAGEAEVAPGEEGDSEQERQKEEPPSVGKPGESASEPGEAPSGGQEQGGNAQSDGEGQDQPVGGAGERQTSQTTESAGNSQAGRADQPPGTEGQPSGQGGHPAGQTGGGGAATQPAQPASQPAATPGADDDQAEETPATQGDSQIGSHGCQELLELLEMLERGEEVPQELLTELGWSAEKAAAFLRALERLRETARRCGVIGSLRRLRAQGELGTEAVQAGRGVSREVSVSVADQASQLNALEQIAPPPEQRVPPTLQALLDAYYRALAERREQAASTRP